MENMGTQEVKPFFSVIIVNFNGGDYLQAAVNSLKNQTFLDFELFIVDNASSDNSLLGLDGAGIEQFNVMLEAENHGFAKGNNIAAKRARGQWLVMLNPDAVADDSWLEKIAEGIQCFPTVKMFSSAQYSLDKPDVMDGAGDNYHIFGIPWRGGYGHRVEEMPALGECFSPCGAGAVFHRQTFFDIGGFDENFFCYCEDVDIAFRMRLKGEKCIFLPQAMIHHAGSALSNQVGDFAVRHGTRNRLWVFVKNMPLLGVCLMVFPHLLMTLLIYLRGIQTGRAKSVRLAFCDGVSGLGPILKKRKDIQQTKQCNSWQIMQQMSWNPVLFLKRKTHIQPILKTDKKAEV